MTLTNDLAMCESIGTEGFLSDTRQKDENGEPDLPNSDSALELGTGSSELTDALKQSPVIVHACAKTLAVDPTANVNLDHGTSTSARVRSTKRSPS
jgi:hypothetical protein